MKNLKTLRSDLLADGFEIIGYFGSQARGDAGPSSDLDILYRLHDSFYSRYPGWKAVGRIQEIQEYIENILQVKTDLANKNGLNRVSANYIIEEVIYVA